MEVAVVGGSIPQMWRKPSGLAVFGPKHFGFDYELCLSRTCILRRSRNTKYSLISTWGKDQREIYMRIDSILGGRKDWKKAIATTAIAIVVIVIIIGAGVGVYYYSVQKTTSRLRVLVRTPHLIDYTTIGALMTTSQASNNVVEYPNSSPMTTLYPSTSFLIQL